MLQCKCMDAHRSGERTPSGPMKGATGSKVKEILSSGNWIWNKKVALICVKLTNCSQPMCRKAFLGNATPCQQYWANSVQKLPSNHLFMIDSKQLLCQIVALFSIEKTLCYIFKFPLDRSYYCVSCCSLRRIRRRSLATTADVHARTSLHEIAQWSSRQFLSIFTLH